MKLYLVLVLLLPRSIQCSSRKAEFRSLEDTFVGGDYDDDDESVPESSLNNSSDKEVYDKDDYDQDEELYADERHDYDCSNSNSSTTNSSSGCSDEHGHGSQSKGNEPPAADWESNDWKNFTDHADIDHGWDGSRHAKCNDQNSTHYNDSKCIDEWEGEGPPPWAGTSSNATDHGGYGVGNGAHGWDSMHGCSNDNATDCMHKERHEWNDDGNDWGGKNVTGHDNGWGNGEHGWGGDHGGCKENSTDANGTSCDDGEEHGWGSNNGQGHGYGKENDEHGWGGEHGGCKENSTDANGTSCDDGEEHGWGSNNGQGHGYGKENDEHGWGGEHGGCKENSTDANGTNCDDDYDQNWWNQDGNKTDHDEHHWNNTMHGCGKGPNSSNASDCHGRGRPEWDGEDFDFNFDDSVNGTIIDSFNETVACYGSCEDVTLTVRACMDANECNVESCMEASDVYSCCPPCGDYLFDAAHCLSKCIPDTMEQSVTDFTTCFDKHECDVSCSDAFASVSPPANVFATSSDTLNNTILTVSEEMCAVIERKFSDPICAINGCCSTCESEMDSVTETMLNQMLRGFSTEVEDCELTCPKSRILALEELSDSFRLRRRAFLAIEEDVNEHVYSFNDMSLDSAKVETTYFTGHGSTLRSLEEVIPPIDITPCLEYFYSYLSIAPDKAFDSLMTCFVQGVQSHSIAVSESRAEQVETDAPIPLPMTPVPTAADTELPTASPSLALSLTDSDAAGITSAASVTSHRVGLIVAIGFLALGRFF